MAAPVNASTRYRELLVIPVTLIILAGWAASLVYALLTAEYTPLAAVTPVMLVMAGYIFGISIVHGATHTRPHIGVDESDDQSS